MYTLVVLSVVIGVAAANFGPVGSGGSGGGPVGQDSYGNQNQYGSGGNQYGNNQNQYGSGPSYGRQGGYRGGFPSYYAPPPPPPSRDDQALDELDQLRSRFYNVLDQLKTAGEIVEALSAQLSRQKRLIDEFNLVTVVALQQTDNAQDTILAQLEAKLVVLRDDIVNVLGGVLNNLMMLNNANLASQEQAEILFAQEQTVDIEQDRAIQALYALVRDLKAKLFQVRDNAVEVLVDRIEGDARYLASVRTQETRRVCEAGEVTLDADDRRVEYQFQNPFQNTPQITFGLSGFNLDIDSRAPVPSYGYGYQPVYEPASIGLRTFAYATPNGINIEAQDTGFGDSSAVTATVSFLACSIYP